MVLGVPLLKHNRMVPHSAILRSNQSLQTKVRMLLQTLAEFSLSYSALKLYYLKVHSDIKDFDLTYFLIFHILTGYLKQMIS